MKKYVKTYSEFLKEAAEWDDPKKKKTDGSFVSFDDDEAYEPEYFIEILQRTIKRLTGEEIDKKELSDVVNDCKGKVAHNHPRKQLLQCVLKHYGIHVTD